MKTIVDRSATFVPSCAERLAFLERAGFELSVADGGCAVLYRRCETGIKLSLEDGERELWVSLVELVDGRPAPIFVWAPAHERRLAQIEIRSSIEEALEQAADVVEGELGG